MIDGLKLPLERLRPVRLRELQENALCFSYENDGAHILVRRAEDGSTGVFLNGDYAFRSFEIDIRNNWKALALTDYEIVVDIASAFDSENRWPAAGTIMIGPEGARLGVTVLDSHGFVDKEALKLDVSIPNVAPGLGVSFRRWAFRVRDGDESQLIWIEAKENGD